MVYKCDYKTKNWSSQWILEGYHLDQKTKEIHRKGKTMGFLSLGITKNS